MTPLEQAADAVIRARDDLERAIEELRRLRATPQPHNEPHGVELPEHVEEGRVF
jgi:hypothetical protein